MGTIGAILREQMQETPEIEACQEAIQLAHVVSYKRRGGLSQKEIAEILQIERGEVCKLIAEAKRLGLLNDNVLTPDDLELIQLINMELASLY